MLFVQIQFDASGCNKPKLIISEWHMGKLNKKSGGVRPGLGRPSRPGTQEYKENPQEYTRKAVAKHCG